MLVGFREEGGRRARDRDRLPGRRRGRAGWRSSTRWSPRSDAEVVLVDRRHRPGGHWLDAYPFVRLHQPSATYGVNSRVLGDDRIDESARTPASTSGPPPPRSATTTTRSSRRPCRRRAGSGSSAWSTTAASDGGDHTSCRSSPARRPTVRVRRRFVDATYTESSIPSRHTPSSTSTTACGSSRRTTSSTSRTRPRATRSSAPARRRWTPAAGCSTSASTPAASAGSGRATAGSSTGPSPSR